MIHRILPGLVWGLVLTLAVCSAGCGKTGQLSGLVPAKGVVTYKGAPVEGATIMFIPTGGSTSSEQRSASATTEADGTFVVMTLQPKDGIFPGQYKVVITKLVPDKVYTEEELKASNGMGIAPPTFTNKLPAKYADQKSTPESITFDKKGNTNIVFELTD